MSNRSTPPPPTAERRGTKRNNRSPNKTDDYENVGYSPMKSPEKKKSKRNKLTKQDLQLISTGLDSGQLKTNSTFFWRRSKKTTTFYTLSKS